MLGTKYRIIREFIFKKIRKIKEINFFEIFLENLQILIFLIFHAKLIKHMCKLQCVLKIQEFICKI